MSDAIYYLTIGELSEQIRATMISPVEIVDACLARIHQLQPRLNAFISLLDDDAREQAKQADRDIKTGAWKGPLHGVPIGIKDFYDTAGSRTTAAFEHFRNRIPKRDAVSVAKLKSAGAIIVGKTNMHQLGMGTTGLDSFFGPVRNPWNGDYISGGSSSGSAAAVAAGLCFATLDTDAIGSCRLPAACCGVVGFKATYGLISSQGILEGEKADEAILMLSHPAVTARSAADIGFLLNALVDQPEEKNRRDFSVDASHESTLTIGVADNFTADQETTSVFKSAVEKLQNLGFDMKTARAPFEMPPFGDLHAIDSDRRTIADRAFKNIDVLVLSTTTTTVLGVKDAKTNPQALSAANTMFANYFALPAISVPCGFDSRGLPIGLQVVGKPGDEASVLQAASRFEAALRFREKASIP
jgi:aspartyl-tRNA(Asn)/glutamyl-tRNA(Gln) amidotransferase subunit A